MSSAGRMDDVVLLQSVKLVLHKRRFINIDT